MAANPLTALTLADLRERRSAKWRRYGDDVLPVWVAEMDTPLAPPIREALAAAVAGGDTGYAHRDGLPEAFAAFATRRWDWPVDPAAVSVVPDVLVGLGHALRTLTAPGDPIVFHTPGYPPFFEIVAHEGRRAVPSPLARDADGGYRLDLDRLERDFAAGARAFILCHPHNPTGLVFSHDELRAVAALADRYGVRVLADEVHAPLVFPGATFTPFTTLSPSAVAFHSASKAWNLAGLKAAVMVSGPEAGDTAPPMALADAIGHFGVVANEVAYTAGEPWLADLLDGLDANRSRLAGLLADALPGVTWHPGNATYFAWLDCRALCLGDDPAEVFLERGRVALHHGPTFGAEGNGFARLNIATSPEILAEAVRRMASAAA